MLDLSGNTANRRSATHLWRGWLMCCALCCWTVSSILAQTPAPPSELVDELRLPLDKIATEQLTDLVPVPLSEYQALKQAAESTRNSPSSTRLLKADYVATYNGHRLTDGRLEWTVQNASRVARTQSFEPLGLAVRDLKWGDQAAVSGTSPMGQLELLVDRPLGKLQGRWELAGKTVGEHDEFALQIPSAAVSQITLQVPVGHTVTAAGLPVSSTPGTEGTVNWRIVLGGRSDCRIIVHQPQPSEVPAPLILVQHDALYAIRQEGLRFQTDLRLEVTNSPVREISIWVDPDLEIYSVTYGNDLSLPWQMTSVDGRQRLLVQLPDPLLGTGRSLRLRGVAPLKTDVAWKLPNVAIAGAALVDGQVALQLMPPLQLQELTSSGFRQIGVEANPARENVLTFKQFRTDGVLTVKLGKSRPRILARVLTDLQTQSSEWRCLSQLQLTSTEGAAFHLDCRVPPGWDVIDVRDTQSQKLDWNIKTTAEGQRLLSLEFLEALSPEKPRTIEIDARRGAASGDQTYLVPAFEPLSGQQQGSPDLEYTLDDLAMLVAVNSSSDVQPVLESGTSFEPCELVELDRDWTSGKFWKPALTDRPQSPLLLRLNGNAPEGHFSLQSLQTPIEVVAEMKVVAKDEKLLKSVKLQVTPRHGKTERLLVYQSELGPQFTWTMTGPNPQPIEARKLPMARHAPRDLPASGELWELRLPQPQAAPFELEGTRVRGLTPTGRLGLVFVPQAQTFRGRVTVEAPAELGLEINSSQTDSENVTTTTPGQQERVWTWHTALAALRFQTRVATELAPSAVVRRVAIRSRWTLEPDSHDYYVVDLELGSGFSGHQFHCTLPKEVKSVEVKVDGQPIQPASVDGRLVLTNVADEQVVTIAYRAVSPGLKRPTWRTLLLPKLEIPVLRCDVELLTPSGFRLGSESTGMVLKSTTPSISTLQRLFGPLGRSPQEVFFNPFSPATWSQSWSHQRGAGGSSTASDVATNEELSQPTADATLDDASTELPSTLRHAGWKVWRGSAAMLPDSIELWIWSNRQATGTAWLGFFACLLVGTGLRMLRVSPRGELGAIALTIEILLAFVLSPLPAQIAGSCLAGTLLAVLWPQRFMHRDMSADDDLQQKIEQGSTHSYFPHSSGLVLKVVAFICLGWCGGRALAQAPAPTSSGGATGLPLPQVLIPVDGNNQPLGQIPLAYVPDRLLKEWNALQSTQNSRAVWLIKSGEYVLRRDAAQQVDFMARYEVTVLSNESEVELTFPLTGLNFGGADACLVDGQPYPILTLPNSKQLIVRVPGVTPTAPPPPPMPESTDASASPSTATTYPVASRTYRVEFHGYPIVQTVADKPWVELSVPRLHAAQWVLQNDDPNQSWTNRMGDTVYTVAAKQSWTREIGPVNKIRIEPLPETAAPAVAPVLEARVALLADVQPAAVQLNYQVNYRVAQGQVSSVMWQLPPGLAVRDVSGTEVFQWRMVPSTGGTARLQIDLQSPMSEGFQIKVKALQPNDGPPTQLTIPSIQLLTPTQNALRPSVSLAGVRTTSEFQPETPRETGEQIAPSTIDEFINEWGKSGLELKPQVAYNLLDPVPLKIGLRPLQPQRVVRMTSVGVLGSRRVQWNLNATIEVQTAAAYSHELEIDPRLNITNVGIQEDAANRLLRWTRSGNILHVFLRDKTTGTQTLTLQATMPNQVPQELSLPTIKFVDATIADARLQLYQEPDLAVELVEPGKWPTLEVPSEVRQGAARNLLVGRFKWDSATSPFLVRTAQNEPLMNYSAVTSVQPRDGRWKMTTNLLFEVLQGHGSQFSIRVPPELPPPVRVDAADVLWYVERESDGGQRILVIPQAPIRGRFVVQVSGEVNLPAGGTTIIPEILGLNATRTEHFVVLPAESQLNIDPRSSGLTPDQVPAELAKLLPTDIQGTTGHQYRGTSGLWTAVLARPQEDAPQTGVLWTETQIWCEPTRDVAGRTSILLGPQEREQVELLIPASVTLQGVLLDGEFVPHASVNKQRLLIPLTFPQSGHALTIYWTQPSTSFGVLYHQAAFDWPRVEGTESAEQFMTLTPPPGFRAHSNHGQSVERITVQLSELQTLLQLLQQRAPGGTAPQDPQWQFLLRQAASLMKRLELEPRLRSRTGALVERFTKLQDQFAPWEQAPSAESPFNSTTKAETTARSFASLEGNLSGPHSLLIKVGTGSGHPPMPVSFVGESVSRWTLGLTLGLLVLAVMWTLLRWKLQEWLSTQPAITWTLFGAIWWTCLTPSWLGLVWLLIAVIYFVRQFVRARSRAVEMLDDDVVPNPAAT